MSQVKPPLTRVVSKGGDVTAFRVLISQMNDSSDELPSHETRTCTVEQGTRLCYDTINKTRDEMAFCDIELNAINYRILVDLVD